LFFLSIFICVCVAYVLITYAFAGVPELPPGLTNAFNANNQTISLLTFSFVINAFDSSHNVQSSTCNFFVEPPAAPSG